MGAILSNVARLARTGLYTSIIAGGVVAGCAVSAQAHHTLFLSGGGFAFRSFSQYSGIISPLSNKKDAFSKSGPMMRFWQRSFAFSYTTNLSPNGHSDTRIDAIGASFSGELGYQKKLSHGEVAGYAGLTYRYFELSPKDPGADLNKNPVGIPITLNAHWMFFDKMSLSTNLAYTFLHEDYWAQFKLGYQTSSTLKFGPEIIFQGGSEYRYIRLGAFISGIKLGMFYLGTNFGLRDDLRESKKSLYGDLHISFFY